MKRSAEVSANWTLNIEYWALNVQHLFNIQHSTPNAQRPSFAALHILP